MSGRTTDLEQQRTGNVRHKRLLIENAIQHVKKVFKSVLDLEDFHPDFIKHLDMINPDDPDAPMKLKQVISKTTQLLLFLDLTSLPLMKIWDYYGDGLMVLKGDKCFAIVHDLQPMTDEGVTMKVYEIHEHMFLCVFGPQVQAVRLFEYALTLNSQHWTNHEKHMCPEEISLQLSACFDNLSDNQCEMVIAGFSDDNEASIYKVDSGGYRQSHADFAVMGKRSADISRQCMDLRENKLDHKKLCDRATEAFGAALADVSARYEFRAHAYTVTPDMMEEKRLEGTEKPRGYYLLS